MIHKLPTKNARPLVTAGALGVAVAACSGAPGNSTSARPLADLKSAEAEAAQADGVAANVALDGALHLITRVKTSTGSVLEFFEPRPGVVQLWELGAKGVMPHSTGPYGKTPTEVFQAARPDLPVPAALITAEARTWKGTFPGSAPATAVQKDIRTESAVVSPESWCGSAWFTQNVPYASWACEPQLYSFAASGESCWLDTFAGTYWQSGNNYVTDAAAYCNPTSSTGHVTISRSDAQVFPAVDVAIPPGWWFNWIDTSTGSTTVCHILGFLDCYPDPNTHNVSYRFDTPNGANISVVEFNPASSGTPSGTPPQSASCQECFYDCGIGCQDVGQYCTNENVFVSAAANPGCGLCSCR